MLDSFPMVIYLLQIFQKCYNIIIEEFWADKLFKYSTVSLITFLLFLLAI